MKSVISFFIKSNIWVAFCVIGLTFSSEIFLGTANFKISQFVFFATIFAYNFQRIIRLNKGNEHAYKNWLSKNKKAIYFLMFIAAVISAYYFFFFQLNTKIAITISAILSILYPLVLRRIPFAKIFIISFVWTISTMLLLVLENNVLISQHVIFHLASRFLFVFAITIPFDIRDVEYDMQNILTIPLFFGVKRARVIAYFSLSICMIISFLQYFEMELGFQNLLALILLYFMASIFIAKSNESRGEIYFSFWVESLSVFGCLFLVISELIF